MPDHQPTRASVTDTLRVAGGVLAPMLAQGVIRRRPRAVALAERLDADRRANRTLQRLRDRHGDGPLLLRVPFRRIAVPFDPDDVREVLAGAPDPFAPATTEKRAALRHFQPNGVLVTRGPERAPRRAVNEAVLDTHAALHRIGDTIARVTAEEADTLLPGRAGAPGASRTVGYDEYAAAFWRAVRRITLGDSARDDVEVSRVLDKLRDAANWAYLHPPRPRLRRRLEDLLRQYVERGEPGSLAREVREQYALPGAARLDPAGQMPHWLFAFDAVAIASARMLALLATHPEPAALARAELGDRDVAQPQYLPYLRGALHESVRLWPTTLVVLRQATARASAGGTELPAGTELVVVSGYFHRDPATVPHADAFAPEDWVEGRDTGAPKAAVIPFSDGPGRCPGENLVLLVATTFAGRLLQHADVALEGPAGRRLDPARPLPGSLNPFGLRFRLTARPVGGTASAA